MLMIGSHSTHPIADTLPLMPPHRLASLVDDIKTNGLLIPIVLHEGQILDGRNRYLACIKAKVEPVFTEYTGDDPFRFVVSMNIERRDLDDGQRAVSSRRLLKLNQQLSLGIDAEDDERAAKLLEDGEPELVKAVDAGEVTLEVAAAIAELEPDEQRERLKALTEKEQPKPERAKSPEAMMSLAIKLTPVDVAALRAVVLSCSKSVHGELRTGAELIKRMVGL